jgi:mevalonate kinase
MVLSRVSESGAILTKEELHDIEVSNRIIKAIDELKLQLSTSQSLTDTMRIERQLKVLIDLLESLGNTSVSLDAIIREANSSKFGKGKMRESIQKINVERGGFAGMYSR